MGSFAGRARTAAPHSRRHTRTRSWSACGAQGYDAICRHAAWLETLLGNVDCAGDPSQLCCAAPAHNSTNLRNISRCRGSSVSSALCRLSRANQSKTRAMSMGDLPGPLPSLTLVPPLRLRRVFLLVFVPELYRRFHPITIHRLGDRALHPHASIAQKSCIPGYWPFVPL
jgi:hypothetical protein